MRFTAVLLAQWCYEKLSPVSLQEPVCCCLNAVGWGADRPSVTCINASLLLELSAGMQYMVIGWWSIMQVFCRLLSWATWRSQNPRRSQSFEKDGAWAATTVTTSQMLLLLLLPHGPRCELGCLFECLSLQSLFISTDLLQTVNNDEGPPVHSGLTTVS